MERIEGFYWVKGYKWSDEPRWFVAHWELGSWWSDGDDFGDDAFIEIDENIIKRNSLINTDEYIKIRLIEEWQDREVKLIGKVLCTRADKHNMSWEFQTGTKYDLYKQTFEDGQELYIVLNNGWYSNFDDINAMSDQYYHFILI